MYICTCTWVSNIIINTLYQYIILYWPIAISQDNLFHCYYHPSCHQLFFSHFPQPHLVISRLNFNFLNFRFKLNSRSILAVYSLYDYFLFYLKFKFVIYSMIIITPNLSVILWYYVKIKGEQTKYFLNYKSLKFIKVTILLIL